MKHLRTYLIYIISLGALLLSACHHDHPEPAPEPPVAARTVIVYMMAENSLSLYVQGDIDEMVAAREQIPDSVNFIIYKDGAKRGDDAGMPTISHLTAKDGLQTVYTFPEDHLSTDSLVALQNLRRIIDAYPARHYAMVFWSHASGWMSRQRRTLGVDNGRNTTSNTGDEMNITGLRWVLEQLPHTDFLFFDACFMQSVETAYELRQVTDWIVGSPAEIPGPGAPYAEIMPHLCQGDAVGVAQTYHDIYPTPGWGSEVVISAIRTDRLEPLAEATRRFLPSVFSGRANVATDGIQQYSSNYDRFTYCYDMNSSMYHLLSAEDYALWAVAFDEAVPCRPPTSSWYALQCFHSTIYDPEHYGAVAMFLPTPSDQVGWNEALRQMQWYQAAGWDETGW